MKMGSNLLLGLAAFIWGIAFVAQSVGMDYVGPFTFNAARFLIGGLVLLPYVLFMRKKTGKPLEEEGLPEDRGKGSHVGLIGGVCCGIALFAGSSLQQLGIRYTTVGKAGFITALYIVIVPVLGIFMKKRVLWTVWLSVAVATVGMYLLCITEGFHVGKGDVYVFFCAIAFSIHILVIDYFSPKADGVYLSCVQFFTAGFLAFLFSILSENPGISGLLAAWLPIIYAGVFSCGVAYTLQVVGQKNTDPVIASLILSLESVFSLLAGWVILGQKLSPRELFGCVLMFGAILMAQMPAGKGKGYKKAEDSCQDI